MNAHFLHWSILLDILIDSTYYSPHCFCFIQAAEYTPRKLPIVFSIAQKREAVQIRQIQTTTLQLSQSGNLTTMAEVVAGKVADFTNGQ